MAHSPDPVSVASDDDLDAGCQRFCELTSPEPTGPTPTDDTRGAAIPANDQRPHLNTAGAADTADVQPRRRIGIQVSKQPDLRQPVRAPKAGQDAADASPLDGIVTGAPSELRSDARLSATDHLLSRSRAGPSGDPDDGESEPGGSHLWRHREHGLGNPPLYPVRMAVRA